MRAKRKTYSIEYKSNIILYYRSLQSKERIIDKSIGLVSRQTGIDRRVLSRWFKNGSTILEKANEKNSFNGFTSGKSVSNSVHQPQEQPTNIQENPEYYLIRTPFQISSVEPIQPPLAVQISLTTQTAFTTQPSASTQPLAATQPSTSNQPKKLKKLSIDYLISSQLTKKRIGSPFALKKLQTEI